MEVCAYSYILNDWNLESQARSNKSAENICGAVAKTGDMKACKFGASCRFNHDLPAFMEQVSDWTYTAMGKLDCLDIHFTNYHRISP